MERKKANNAVKESEFSITTGNKTKDLALVQNAAIEVGLDYLKLGDPKGNLTYPRLT